MVSDFTPAFEKQLLELRLKSLNSEEFWSAFNVPNSPYLEYIWRQLWLPGHLSAMAVWQAGKAMSDPASSAQLWQFPHQPLAGQLPVARSLEQQQVPGLMRYADYLLEQGSAKGQLHTLMQQISRAEAEDVDFMLERIADILLNQVLLCVGVHRYRLREIEFYFHQPRTHPDPYVHLSNEQQQCGYWYFNKAGGLDLTFGDGERNTWGGVLLRGLETVLPAPNSTNQLDFKEKIYTSGPQLVLRELIAHLNGVFESPRGIELDEVHMVADEPTWRVRRYGLRHRPETDVNQDFLTRRYRFLVGEAYVRSLKDRADVVRQLKLRSGEAKRILGYYPTT